MRQNGTYRALVAKGAEVAPQSAGELVEQLEELGYVERRPDPDDRRAKRIYRTGKAKRATQAAITAAQRSEEKIKRLLGERRYTQVRHDLADIIEAQSGHRRNPYPKPVRHPLMTALSQELGTLPPQC